MVEKLLTAFTEKISNAVKQITDFFQQREIEITELSSEKAAKVALERIEQERERDRKETADRRLRNIKLLLKNYKLLRSHAENAVYDGQLDAELEDSLEFLEELMMPGKYGTLTVQSIKRSAKRTEIMVSHTETMLTEYQKFCYRRGREVDLRRWRVIEGLYITEPPKSRQEIATEEFHGEETAIDKDVTAACKIISVLIFGMDGMEWR